jgi:hypothetical protein
MHENAAVQERVLADLEQLARPRHARWDELGLLAVRSFVLPGLSRAMGAHVTTKVLPVPFQGRQLPDVRLSDHSPFWDAGYNAVMLTDTSFMRNPYYHQSSDTLDLPFLLAVIDGLEAAIGGC